MRYLAGLGCFVGGWSLGAAQGNVDIALAGFLLVWSLLGLRWFARDH